MDKEAQRSYGRYARRVTPSIRKKILKRDGELCQYCGTDSPDYGFAIDHIVPVKLGGFAAPFNLTVACTNCNAAKGDSVWIPDNLSAITNHHPAWRERIIKMANGQPTRPIQRTPAIRPGAPALGQTLPTTYYKFAMLEYQHEYLMERAEAEGVSAAEYLRQLIERDMRRPPDD